MATVLGGIWAAWALGMVWWTFSLRSRIAAAEMELKRRRGGRPAHRQRAKKEESALAREDFERTLLDGTGWEPKLAAPAPESGDGTVKGRSPAEPIR